MRMSALTKQVVPCQCVQDAGCPDQVAHGSREGGGVDPDGDERVPHVDVPQEAVIPLEKDAGGRRGEEEKRGGEERKFIAPVIKLILLTPQ